MKRKTRKPRALPSTGLVVRKANVPAHYNDAEVATILIDLYKRHEHTFTSEASNTAFEAFFLRRLLSSDMVQSSLDAIFIVDLARRGQHPAADAALRKAIILASREGRFDHLPLAVRAYNDELLVRDPIVYYSPNAPQVINDYVRNIVIGRLVDVVSSKFPFLPKYTSASTGERSPADLVGIAFGFSERQVHRIYKKHREIPALVRDFFREHVAL